MMASIVLAVRRWLRPVLRGRARPLWSWLVLQYWRLADHVRVVEPPVFAQLRRLGPLSTDRMLPAVRGRRILFVGTRQERDQVIITSILAGALALRGHEVRAVHCDRAIPSCCDTGVYPGLTAAQCEMCFRFARKIRSLSDLPTAWLSDFVTAADRDEARALVRATLDDDLPHLKAEGLPLGEIAQHSVAHFLRSDELEDATSLRHYRDWLIGGIVVARAWKRVLAAERPDVIVMLSGYFMPERIMFELAHAMGVHVVTYEIGTGSETLVFDHDHLIDYDLEWEWANFRDVPLVPAETEQVRRRMDERRQGRSHLVNYWPTREEDRQRIVSELSLAERPTAVLFTNLTWDSAVFGKDVMFRSMEAWAIHTIEWFRTHPEAQLIVRVHPAEEIYRSRHPVDKIIKDRVGPMPSNVILVEPTSPMSSYVLAELADFGVVYTSTMGLELPVLGKRVIVCGDAHYRDKGFTLDPRTIPEYESLLAELCREPAAELDAARHEMAMRYAHYFFFRLGRPLSFLRYPLASEIPQLRITSRDELLPGRDPTLDRICSAIVDGGSFIVDG